MQLSREDLGGVHMRYDADNCATRFEFHTTEPVFQAAMAHIKRSVAADFAPYAVCTGDYEEECWGWHHGDRVTVGATAMDGAFVVSILVPRAIEHDDWTEGADPSTWIECAAAMRAILKELN